MSFLNIFAAWILILFELSSLHAATLSGKVTDESGKPLSFTTVYVKGTTQGTTTNDEGFYSLTLPPGEYNIVFQYIGYQKKEHHVVIKNEPFILNTSLKLEALELSEVVVTDGEDPAYRVIRAAIKKKNYFLRQTNAFSCNAYIKGVFRLDTIPDKIFVFNLKKSGMDTSMLGIVYLSESESKYYFEQPDKVKEVMISSKVSGDSQGFSWNQASQFDFDFYKNLAWDKFISPLSETALLYYRYKMIGTFYEEDQLVNKIAVIPKRRADPVFSGVIYIVENSWRIHSADLWLKNETGIEGLDSLEVKQSFGRVNDTTYMPFNQAMNAFIGILGFRAKGKFVGVFSKYEINPSLPVKFFNGEELKVNEDANKKDSTYWEANRPVPLTEEELTDYHDKDSIAVIENSKTYLDSADRKNNRFKFSDLITGYNYYRRYNKTNYGVTGLLNFIRYNTVEGFAPVVKFNFTKDWEDNRRLSLNPTVRYGFSNQLFSFKADFDYLDNAVASSRWLLSAGSYVFQYNENNPIQDIVNTIYTLLWEENHMKLYKNEYLKAGYSREVINGLKLSLQTSYNHRTSLENSTNYTWNDRDDISFTPNEIYPTGPCDSGPCDEINYNSWIVTLSADIRIRQKYITRPNEKIVTGTKFPLISLRYTRGIPLMGSDVNFDQLEAAVSDGYNCGIFGSNHFRVAGGIFLTNEFVGGVELKHFNGNQTIFASSDRMDSYQVLPYYDYSTDQHYVEAHYEQHFEGLILNRIPLVRKWKWQEVAGFHYLYTPEINYAEINIGIEHIFSFLRVDFVTSYSNTQHLKSGVIIGFNFPFGINADD